MANRFTFPRETALDANGNPLAGAKLEFYEAGTTNPADSFADEALTVANANPVVADSAGRFGDIFLQAIDYKVILKDAADVTIWIADPVSGTVIATGDKFIPGPSDPEAMTIELGAGTLFDTVTKTRLTLAAQTSPLVVAPSSLSRWDIVYISRRTGVVGIQTGVENASPVDPTIPDGKVPVARVRLATTTVSIGPSLIDDIRELEQLGDFGPQDIQNQTFTAFDDTGAANAYVITPDPAIAAYTKYQAWVVDIANANTGASTMNIGGLGVRNIFDYRTGAALVGGDIAAGIHHFVDDGTQLILMNPDHANIDVQVFTASGTWTKPSRASRVLVEAWGGGGGGAGVSSAGGGGGGGGAYVFRSFDAADLGSIETVTIGAGGIRGIGGVSGNAGGNSAFGSLLTAYGGSGGIVNNNGGGGGGWGGPGVGQAGDTTYTGSFNGRDGATGTTTPQGTAYGGGGGGYGAAGAGSAGGASIFGGGGGGGRGLAGGSSLYGGSGGASGAPPTAGTAPGGGGGGGNGGSGTDGADGARGEMRVTTWMT